MSAPAPFARVGAALARSVLAGSVPRERLEEAAQLVVAAVGELPLHPDVPGGVRALTAQGSLLMTLTNGSAATSRQLLSRGGVEGAFEQVLSVQDAPGGAWKPAASAYRHACAVAGVAPARALLVAVHPWDVDGAARVGLATAWIDRSGVPYPDVFTAPDLVASGVEDLARQLRAV